MNNFAKVFKVWKEILCILDKKQKKKCINLMAFMLLGNAFELLGIALIVPFIEALINPQSFLNNDIYAPFLKSFQIVTDKEIIMFMCFFIIIIYVLKNLYLIWLSYAKVKTQCVIEKSMALQLMKHFSRKDYEFYLNTNSNEINRIVDNDVMSVYQILVCSFDIFINATLILAVAIYVFVVNIKLAIMVIFVAVLCVLIIFCLFKNLLSKQGKEYLKQKKITNQYVLQMLEGIKEVILGGKQDYFVKKYEYAYERRNKAEILRTFSGDCPGFIIEATFVMCFIIMIAGESIQSKEAFAVQIPFLASFAVAAFKVLPLIAKLTGAMNKIVFNRQALANVSKYLAESKNSVETKQEDYCVSDKMFEGKVDICDVSYKYKSASKEILKNINISINKGDSIALIGSSGAGKTTLANIMLGLLESYSGKIEIDNIDIKELKNKRNELIGYVPQSVFLIDDTIRNNIAFGIEDENIDEEKIWNALEKAQLADFVKNLPEQLDTFVGERGVRFSGGQRQRLAIARALYFDPSILILDEATSALDNETESAVMEAIERLQGEKTLIIVAHRLSTIRKCDVIYEIRDGQAIKKNCQEVLRQDEN